MKMPNRVTVLLIFLVLSVMLASGCTTSPVTGDQPPLNTPVPPAAADTPLSPHNPKVPPAPPSQDPTDRIGKDGGGVLFQASGYGTTGIRVDDPGYYRFMITNPGDRPLKLYLTSWDGNRTLEIYDSTSGGNSTKRSLELIPGNYYFWAVSEGRYSIQAGFDH
jgi:hypothetical protein